MSKPIIKFFPRFYQAHEYVESLDSSQFEKIETYQMRPCGWEVVAVPKFLQPA